MAIINMRPDTLQYLDTADGYVDEIGDYHEGECLWSDDIRCNAVPAKGETSERTFEDGVTRSYSFTVYLPPKSRLFSVGEKIRLTRLGQTYTLEVKGCMPYQMQTKLWLG